MNHYQSFCRLSPAVVLSLACLWLNQGCQKAPEFPEFGSEGVYFYDYEAYGDDGEVIVSGIMALKYDSPTTFTGIWQFKQVSQKEAIGPQVGSGKLTGKVTRGEYRINLNPELSERNVLLVGSMLGSNLDGAWRWMGATIQLNQGKFLARPRTEPPPKRGAFGTNG